MSLATPSIAEELDARRCELARRVVSRQFECHPELEERYGRSGLEACVRDTEYALQHLAVAVDTGEHELFVSYLGWAHTLLLAHDVPLEDLIENLNQCRAVLADEFGDEAEPAVACLSDGCSRLQNGDVVPCTAEPLRPGLAFEYLHRLLEGDRATATRLVADAMDAGMSAADVYQSVFQPAQWEVGRLWQLRQVSVAQEHYCTAATQFIMSQVYARSAFSAATGPIAIVTCVAGELHELGARMVADSLEMHGWRARYLGANMPVSGIVSMIEQQEARLLAVSATLYIHVRFVRDLIQAVRKSEPARDIHILAGGSPFRLAPNLSRWVGADSTAADAGTAARLAEEWL